MFLKWAYIPALVATLALPSWTRDVFVTPPDSNSTVIGAYGADPLSSAGTFSPPASVSAVLRGPGNKYYGITRSSVDAILVMEGTFPNLSVTRRIGLSVAPATAAISPDGRRLVVVSGNIHVFDTASDTDLTPSGIDAGSSPSSVAVSVDSNYAFVLSPGSQRLTSVSLTTGALQSTQTLPGVATSVAVGPNGRVYVTAPNTLLEYDALTLTASPAISLNAFPRSVSFTPDGRFALLVNSDVRTGSSLIAVDLIRRTFVIAPPVGLTQALTKVVASSNTSAYGFSTATGRLYSFRLTVGSDVALVAEPVSFGSSQVDSIRDIAVTRDVPARYLLAVTGLGLYRIDTTNSSVSGPLFLPTQGELSVTSTPITTGALTATPIRDTFTVAAGQPAVPVVLRVVNASGYPVAGVPVTWTASTGGTIANATAVTSNDGLASAYVSTAATFNGTVTVTGTATGVASPATFSLTQGSGSGGGGTAGLSIVQGTGQPLSEFQTSQFNEALQVRVRDAAGQPVVGASVTWAVKTSSTQGSGTISPNISVTDAQGIAQAQFTAGFVQPGIPFITNIISASTGSESVDFYVTTIPALQTGPANINILPRQSADTVLEGRAGETLAGAIRYDVFAPLGQRLPFIGIRVVTQSVDAAGNPAVQCRGGIALSDIAGITSCDLVLGNVTGEVSFQVYVAGRQKIDNFKVRITPGRPSLIQAEQGNNQTGNPGQRLTTPLLARVFDAGGGTLAGVTMQWSVVSGSATLSDLSTITDVNGRVSAVVTLGQVPGPVVIRVQPADDTTVFAAFNLAVNVAATRLVKVAGADNQIAVVGQAFSQPLAVTVQNAQGGAVANAAVTFAVTQGSATLGTPTATSNASGVASTTITAGQTAGPVTVTARFGAITETFTLTVRTPGPVFTASSFVNAAGYQPGISPGTIAVISGSGFAPNVRGTVGPQNIVGPLPYRLSDVEVLFNNVPAPIFSVTNNNGQEMVIVQVPYETVPGSASVTIRSQGGGSTTITGVEILPLKPGIFEFIDSANGRRYAVAVRPDGSYVSSTNPARRGEIIRFFATGLGAVTPASGTNRVGLDEQNVVAPVIVGVNNAGTRLLSAKLQPGSVGVYIVTFEVPADTQPGPGQNFAIVLTGADGVAVYGNGSAIPIQ